MGCFRVLSQRLSETSFRLVAYVVQVWCRKGVCIIDHVGCRRVYSEHDCILEWTTSVRNKNITVDLQRKGVCYVLCNGACGMDGCQDSDV
jgi:hypothetical protein